MTRPAFTIPPRRVLRCDACGKRTRHEHAVVIDRKALCPRCAAKHKEATT